METLLAEEVTDLVGMGIGFFVIAIVPLVYMLLHHQRKMTEMLRGSHNDIQEAKIQSLESEVQLLKDRVNSLVLHVEDRGELQQRVSPPEFGTRR